MDEFFKTAMNWLGVEAGYTLKYVGLRGGLPLWPLLVLVCLAVAVAVFAYARETSLSRNRRIMFAVLRAVLYSLVLFFLFGPVIGLERSQTIRPSLLVLVDRSASMNIADPRQPDELADAALAVGAARFAMPQQQSEVARAQQAALASLTAMKQLRWDDSIAASGEILTALSKALTAPAADGSDASADAPLRKITAALTDLARRQGELRAAVEELSSGASATTERIAPLRDQQEQIRRDLAAAGAEMAAASVPMTATNSKDLAATSRSAMAKGLLSRPELGRLGNECNLHYFTFGDKLAEIGAPGADVEGAALQPNAPASRGAQAIREAVAQYGQEPIAGVVMLTDGAFNDETAQPLATAGWLKEQGVPFYAVGLGLQAPRDVGLRSLIVQEVMFPKDLVTARVQVTSSGYSRIATEVVARLDGVEIAKRTVELTGDPQFAELAFRVPEGKAGLRQLTFEMPPQPGEVSTRNNKLEKPVRIVDQRIKVLFVEGRPRWEYRYLRVLLQRDPRLDVKFLMTQGDPDLAAGSKEYLAQYPEKPEDAFIYDLVILGDVPSWYFSRPQLQRIVELVRDRGGALLMLSGEQYAPVSYVDSPLAEILPVRATRDYMQMPESVFPIATSTGKLSIAMLADNDPESNEAWKRVRPLHRVPRLDGAKPGASVLVELPEGPNRPEPYPLVAWHYAGSGKVMYVGTDQLWRLRLKLGDRYHGRFWGQAIQFLALSRLMGENKRVHIEADTSGEVRTGQRVEIHANVLDPTYQPVSAEKYTLQLLRMGSQPNSAPSAAAPVVLTPVPGSPGLFQGSYVFQEEGRYQLRAADADARFANTVDVLVSAADLEGLEPAMQESLLNKMSALSAGRFVTVREWPALPGLIQARQRVVTESREWDLWDSWPLFVVLLLCAGAEWLLRRRLNLV